MMKNKQVVDILALALAGTDSVEYDSLTLMFRTMKLLLYCSLLSET